MTSKVRAAQILAMALALNPDAATIVAPSRPRIPDEFDSKRMEKAIAKRARKSKKLEAQFK